MPNNVFMDFMQTVAAKRNPQLAAQLQQKREDEQALLQAANASKGAPAILDPLMKSEQDPIRMGIMQSIQARLASGHPAYIKSALDDLTKYTGSTLQTREPTALIKEVEYNGPEKDFLRQVLVRPQTQVNIGDEKPPVNYRWRDPSKTSVVPITGGPADPTTKQLNEAEAKGSKFAADAAAANEVLNKYDDLPITELSIKQGVEDLPMVGQALGAAVNTQLSGGQQIVDQAQRQFITAVLRQDSQGTIRPDEFDAYRKIYFPQYGDNKDVKEYKRKARALAVKSLANIAGPAASINKKPAERKVVAYGTAKDGRRAVKYSDGTMELLK